MIRGLAASSGTCASAERLSCSIQIALNHRLLAGYEQCTLSLTLRSAQVGQKTHSRKFLIPGPART